MPASLENVLVVAVSSRALFDLEAENKAFSAEDDTAYRALQLGKLDVPAPKGVAYPLIHKLLAFNSPSNQRVEAVILSRNDPVSGLRVFHSAAKMGLPLTRGVFTRGRPPLHYLRPLKANLFLSANNEDVIAALRAGFPAARVYPESVQAANAHPHEVRVAFDGDAVLFSDEAERVFREQGREAFELHETEKARAPLIAGPFMPFLRALHQLQQVKDEATPVRIRTALVTARSAPAHERAIRTLMSWNIEIDEAMFLGGLEKGPFLREYGPDFFFDDQTGHCESARLAGPTGHVISGVANEIGAVTRQTMGVREDTKEKGDSEATLRDSAPPLP